MDAEVIAYCIASDVIMGIGLVAAMKAAMDIARED